MQWPSSNYIRSYLSIFPLLPLSLRANFELAPSSIVTLMFRIYTHKWFCCLTQPINIDLKSLADTFHPLRTYQSYWTSETWTSQTLSTSKCYYTACGESWKYISELKQDTQTERIELSWWMALREKCPNTELFLVRIFLYSDWIRSIQSKCRIRIIRTRNKSVFGHFSRSVTFSRGIEMWHRTKMG